MVIKLLPYVIGGIILFIVLYILCRILFIKIVYSSYKRKLKSEDFLNKQIENYKATSTFIESLLSSTEDLDLDWGPSSKVWSIGDCLKHIELYNVRYVLILEKAITKAKNSLEPMLLSGRIVYLSDALLPDDKNGKIYRRYFFKTKTKKRYNPKLPKNLFGEGILQQFLSSNNALIEILQNATNKNLNKKILIKDDFGWGFRLIRLGELIEIITAHNMRHFRQIVKIYQNYDNYIRDRSLDEDRSQLLSLEPM